MILRIIAVGKLKERHWREVVAEYDQRLGPYARLETFEVPEAKMQDCNSEALQKSAMELEARAILKKLEKEDNYVIALDRVGESISSLGLAKLLDQQILNGRNMTWIIGGPFGLAPTVIKEADLTLSFSSLTFPHQMIRLILLEQIYRAFRIIHHEPYHK
jgi:23S rRNA (pseudouridine1915-N3)-methyltransferase